MILVTGGAGFIGSRLCRALAARGEHVVSLDDYSTGSRANHVAGVDYREGKTCWIAELVPERPDVIFHLGEYARVGSSFRDREIVEQSNVVGTAFVYDYWLDRRCKLVYAGSSTRFAIDGTNSPYSESKKHNADRALVLAAAHKLSCAVAYFYNAYGPGERAGEMGTLIETFLQRRLAGLALQIVEPGDQRRNFTHVDDIVDGLLLIAVRGEGEFPIGNDVSWSVQAVAGMIGGAVEWLPERPGNRWGSTIDTSRIEALGWWPRRQLVDYLSERLHGELACAS